MEPPKTFHVRDPIHGMIGFNSLEWEIINSEPFQRLRRIRQLAWTDYVYPGAIHTRFEHTLGVCHVATRLFDSIIDKDEQLLRTHYKLTSGVDRQRQIIRLAALTHDLGHGPLSHAAEEALPINAKTDKQYTHEHYSSKVVDYHLRDIVEHHPLNKNNYRITVDEIVGLFSESGGTPNSVVWREIISGQMDADRMDYLLRDSFHCGVSYGRYDLDRIVNTVRLCEDEENECHVVGIDEDGLHAVEGLLIARYMMFTQVYFHKTRVAFDYHYEQALKHFLKKLGGHFPGPTQKKIGEYLKWDDWKVLHLIVEGKENPHCRALSERNHHRQVYWTPECPDEKDRENFDRACDALQAIDFVVRDAKKSWYKYQQEEILISEQKGTSGRSVPLATRSPVVNGLRTVNQRRIYVSPSDRREALKRLEGL